MWSATRPQAVGRYGWRPSPAEPGRPVDIVQPAKTRFAIDATGHVVEGGEWWQGPVYAWEQSVSAELLAAAKRFLKHCPCCFGSGIVTFRGEDHVCPECESLRVAMRCAEQQPADTRDAEIARLRAALESLVSAEYDLASLRRIASAALGEKP